MPVSYTALGIGLIFFVAGLVPWARSVGPTREMLRNRKPGAAGFDALMDHRSFTDIDRYTEEGLKHRAEALRLRWHGFTLSMMAIAIWIGAALFGL